MSPDFNSPRHALDWLRKQGRVSMFNDKKVLLYSVILPPRKRRLYNTAVNLLKAYAYDISWVDENPIRGYNASYIYCDISVADTLYQESYARPF